MSASLLLEIGVEELPVKSLSELAGAFAAGIANGLTRRGLGIGAYRALYSPRRLAVLIADVAAGQPAQRTELLGPYLSVAVDANGAPTRALEGFAAKVGVPWTALERTTDAKGERFVHRQVRPGARTVELVQAVFDETLRGLPIPKPMRWGAHEHTFARPVLWLVALFGGDIVPLTAFGHVAGRDSRGHRFMHDRIVSIETAEAYVDALRAAKVMVDPAERRAAIVAEVTRAAAALGGTPRLRHELVDEVVNLVEWPCAIACGFDREFLAVPQEALIMTMEANQRFFPVLDGQGRLTEHFIGIANIDSRDPAEVRKGYERVIRPRFADAKFFYNEDLKTPLDSHQAALKKVMYHVVLGSVWEKCQRVAKLASLIANRCGVEAELATKAATLAKCDLMTRMVGEFPELQGTMGRYYALAQGIEAEIAWAIEESYAPRFAGDAIAASPLGRVLAIADKIDTLASLFVIGQRPSGNKDPFSLRRAALGLARTLIEGGIELDLLAQIDEAVDQAERAVQSVASANEAAKGAVSVGVRLWPKSEYNGRRVFEPTIEVFEFILDRLRAYYAEQGIASDRFQAVAALKPTDLADFDRRLRALNQFVDLPEAAALAAANKRIANILRQAAGRDEKPAEAVDTAALTEREEQTLAAALAEHGATADTALAGHDYVGALKVLARLRPAVDAFFERVMVMAEDPAVRRQRLALLADVRRRFVAIADISLLQS